MRVIVFHNEGPDQGIVLLNRELADDEIMRARTFADQIAHMYDREIDSSSTGYVPNCCGDIRVEFIDHDPVIEDGRYQGSVCIWSGNSYYFSREDI